VSDFIQILFQIVFLNHRDPDKPSPEAADDEIFIRNLRKHLVGNLFQGDFAELKIPLGVKFHLETIRENMIGARIEKGNPSAADVCKFKVIRLRLDKYTDFQKLGAKALGLSKIQANPLGKEFRHVRDFPFVPGERQLHIS
jgi:hypothetical protein